MLNFIMVDIETLGTTPGSVILSVAMVQFDLETVNIGCIYHWYMDMDESKLAGFTTDLETLSWWGEQNEELIRATFGEHIKREPIADVLGSIGILSKNMRVWGNSARFDLGLLSAYYDKLNMPIPWSHRQEMDVRTLANLYPHIKEGTEFTGVKHNPIDDCLHQIKYTCAIYREMKGAGRGL